MWLDDIDRDFESINVFESITGEACPVGGRTGETIWRRAIQDCHAKDDDDDNDDDS